MVVRGWRYPYRIPGFWVENKVVGELEFEALLWWRVKKWRQIILEIIQTRLSC